MKRLAILQSVSATVLCAALVAAFFINPFIAGAANTYSAQLDRNSTQYFEAPDSASLSVTNNATLETWVKFSVLPPPTGDSSSALITHWDSSVGQKGFLWRLRNQSGVMTLDWTNSGDGSNEGGLLAVNWTPSTNVWYHLAVTFASGTVKFYVNGAQQGATLTSSEPAIFDSSAAVDVGSIQGPNELVTGKIDDVRFYNTARSSSAIASDYAQELIGNETGLVAYWKLNNDGGVDATTNSNNLSEINGLTYSTDVPFPVVPPFTEQRKVRKSADESVASSITLQNDDQIKLGLKANTTYIVDGVIFASATNGTPDIKISFSGVSGTVATLGYTNDVSEEVLGNNTTSSRIAVGTTAKSIHIHGTVVTGPTNGDFQLKWAQNTSNSHPTSVLLGSYLRAEEI